MSSKKKSDAKTIARVPRDWREWWMAQLMPKYEDNEIVEDTYVAMQPGVVVAEDLEGAFRAARCRWPSATSGWICLGGVHAKDCERVVHTEDSGTVQLLEMRKGDQDGRAITIL